jgi:uncharacterized protein YjhX (UPF0386 family)
MIGKVLKLPECNNSIVIPIRHSGGGYICTQIRNNKEIVSAECYVREDGFEDAIDLTEVLKAL